VIPELDYEPEDTGDVPPPAAVPDTTPPVITLRMPGLTLATGGRLQVLANGSINHVEVNQLTEYVKKKKKNDTTDSFTPRRVQLVLMLCCGTHVSSGIHTGIGFGTPIGIGLGTHPYCYMY
jgi:hypothetical protein